MVERMNQSTGAVLVLDIPSGVEADTGAATVVDGKLLAVRADVTVSFVGRKIGLHTGAGAGFVGEQHLVDLGISDEFPGSTSQCHFASLAATTVARVTYRLF